jgi:hypothetical protein
MVAMRRPLPVGAAIMALATLVVLLRRGSIEEEALGAMASCYLVRYYLVVFGVVLG